jgi:carbon storage regulator CsrA
MLVLSRKEGEVVYIGPDIVLTVIRLGRGRVELGIAAPPHIRIRRAEISAVRPSPLYGCESELRNEAGVEHVAAG